MIIFKFANELGLEYTSNTFFGLVVAIWFVVNEMLSILENIGRMGAELPDFLKNVLSELRKKLNDKDK
ncbi:MAG: phage holin family protein [Lachnospiraceae bacterium]|nr:phage holin family protein [Lachnospiraceae bacterium]